MNASYDCHQDVNLGYFFIASIHVHLEVLTPNLLGSSCTKLSFFQLWRWRGAEIHGPGLLWMFSVWSQLTWNCPPCIQLNVKIHRVHMIEHQEPNIDRPLFSLHRSTWAYLKTIQEALRKKPVAVSRNTAQWASETLVFAIHRLWLPFCISSF